MQGDPLWTTLEGWVEPEGAAILMSVCINTSITLSLSLCLALGSVHSRAHFIPTTKSRGEYPRFY